MAAPSSHISVRKIDGVMRIDFVDRNILDELNIHQIGEELLKSVESETKPKVVVVMPAYNAQATIEKTWREVVAHDVVDLVIVVDDASKDDTMRLAQGLDKVIAHRHPTNLGYGGNQKTCYEYCLETGADIIVMIHPDYQYDSRVIPHAVGIIELGICDVVLGNRIRSRSEARSCGMPWWKYVSNRGLTAFENLMLGQNLGEFHSGFRVYRRSVLETIPFERNSDDFVFDT